MNVLIVMPTYNERPNIERVAEGILRHEWARLLVVVDNSPDGTALKFVHRGSYDNMDNTYEAITNHLDDKKLEAKDTFIEEYLTDPLKTAEDKLVINVFVPLK